MTAETEDGFQFQTPATKKKPQRRLYISDLPKNSTDTQILEWIHQITPDASIERARPTAVLVSGTSLSIKTFQQRPLWNGRIPKVQWERKPKGKKNNNGWTQSSWSKPTVDEATHCISNVVQEEIQQSQETGGNMIDTALASTAAASLLISAMTADSGEHASSTEPSSFAVKPMSELLADFGQEDKDWQKKRVDDIPKQPSNRLATHGKAPIHVCFSSFSYDKGIPPSSPYNPPALDTRGFPSIPRHLNWQTGLSSEIKRILQNQGLRRFAQEDVLEKVWDTILDAQESGYGYAAPVKATVWIGSALGKHRSVAVCEWAALALRERLRSDAREILQPVSVETFHRELPKQNETSCTARERRRRNNEFADEDED